MNAQELLQIELINWHTFLDYLIFHSTNFHVEKFYRGSGLLNLLLQRLFLHDQGISHLSGFDTLQDKLK